MAKRPVFITWKTIPYADFRKVEFAWNGGFALSQSQKNVKGLHEAFNAIYPDQKVLEISSKSMQEIGVKLSAFSLQKFVPSLGVSRPVECVYHGGKTFRNGGPYTDLYTVSPKEAKRDPRLYESGPMTEFFFEGIDIPLVPETAFYNWLYINALLENGELAKEIVQYDAFTDIVFNPEKSINCQAMAAAQFVALHRKGLIEECRDFDKYLAIITGK